MACDNFSYEAVVTEEEGVKCSVPTCDNVDVEGCGMVFHRFPISRPVILKKWLIQLQREDWMPTIEDRVCNNHFDLRWFIDKDGEKGVPQRSYLDRPKQSQELSDPDEPEAVPCRSYVRKKKRPNESVQVTPDAKRPPSPIGLVMRKPIDSLQDIVNGLKESGKLTPLLTNLLEKVCSSTSQEEMDRILRDYRASSAKAACEAYEDVQKLYDVAIPPVPVARAWMSNTTCGPGFPGAVYENIREKASTSITGRLLCTVVVDDMSIRKEISHDGRNVRGYIDFGTAVEDDSLPAARNVLVFIVVSLKLDWKAPCAYFFIDDLSDRDMAGLLRLCISKLHDARADVVAVTFGGPTFNAGLLRELGADPSPESMRPWFPHPECPDARVHIVFDARQMQALVKTSLALLHRICDSTASEIRWNYVMELHRAQAFVYPPGHRFASVDWDELLMRVSLSEPVLGLNFANGIEFCGRALQMPQFRGCEATIRFIKTFHQLTEMLRSTTVTQGFGAPLESDNVDTWKPFLESCKTYISNLTDIHGSPITSTNRKTPYLAFLVTIESLLSMCSKLLLGEEGDNCSQPPVQRFLTGCMSQDHAEELFAAIRKAARRERLNATLFRIAIRKVLACNDGPERRSRHKPLRRGVLCAVQKFCEKYKLPLALG
ncbi:hypothetical protein HPB50_026657 [Hyalomma asiaticum]|uniref:Uncharacterized protein n=1 Tax=Hyalomma asiaticum TaxID=266040 RepID=A0ACB7RTB1_HYAAI|nr:hypothetical protein HPB50_026657 [Hyalomma asiaticum]